MYVESSLPTGDSLESHDMTPVFGKPGPGKGPERSGHDGPKALRIEEDLALIREIEGRDQMRSRTG